MSERYRFTPTGPILIEIFPRHDDFAVRNVGLPGMIGALGACFGKVVTLDSPRARPPGTFNWQATMYHELAHVVTLQMSANRIPRWLTEGISVYEEQQARPEWGRDMDLEFADALERGTVIGLPELNAGFMDPTTISMAYYEASLLVEYLVEISRARWARVAGARVRRWRRHRRHAEEDAQHLAIGTAAAVHGLAERALRCHRQGAARAPGRRHHVADAAPDARGPRDGDTPDTSICTCVWASCARRRAIRQARTARGTTPIELVPAATGEDGPRARIAKLAVEQGDAPRAIEALEGILEREGANVDAARQLAMLLDRAEQPGRAAKAWARVAELDPFDANASAVLGRQALESSRCRAGGALVPRGARGRPADRAAAHCDLAESYLGTGQSALAKRQVLAALENAPMYARAQDLLLAIVDGTR